MTITQEYLKSQLHYNKETGIFTRLVSQSNRIKVGSVAGSWDNEGYLRISVGGKRYLSHRLAWLYINGQLPKLQIDHINHNRSDNRIANIREVTQQDNLKNKSIQKNNNSGHPGVTWHKLHKKWSAQISIKGKYKHLGWFANIEDAINARKIANVEHNFHCHNKAI